MKNLIALRAAAAMVSLAVTLSAANAFTMAENAEDTSDTTAAVLSQEGLEPISSENSIKWDKADISDYESSLSLISYELTNPDMYKSVPDAQPDGADTGQLTEEQKAMIMLIRKSVKNNSPILGKKIQERYSYRC